MEIVKEIKTAAYYSIVLDSSPDISHMDQLTFVVRYVTESGKISERFIEFIPIVAYATHSTSLKRISRISLSNHTS